MAGSTSSGRQRRRSTGRRSAPAGSVVGTGSGAGGGVGRPQHDQRRGMSTDPVDGVPGDPEQDLGDPESVARSICLRLLTMRARSRAELSAALAKRGVPAESASRVLDRFTEVGLIDDDALARALAGAQHRERGLARRAVAAKLRQRGLPDESVADALTEIDGDSERARATALVQRRLPALRGLPLPVQQRRLNGLLGRKGYSAGLSWEVVRSALRDVGPDLDHDIDQGADDDSDLDAVL